MELNALIIYYFVCFCITLDKLWEEFDNIAVIFLLSFLWPLVLLYYSTEFEVKILHKIAEIRLENEMKYFQPENTSISFCCVAVPAIRSCDEKVN